MEYISLTSIAVALFLITIAITAYTSRKESARASSTRFLLADKTLDQASVVNLLLSSSFGVNAIFYAAWLGYSLGGWALIIQACWAVSFILLARFSEHFQQVDSLHDFLGKKFGSVTRLVAATLSIVGIMFFVGWEAGIAEGALSTLEQSYTGDTTQYLTQFVVFSTLVYTIIGGLKGNASVNIFMNGLKVLSILLLLILAIGNFKNVDGKSFIDALFPPIDVLITNFGIWGLITNILFNLSWQFVDNSSWQSVISGSKKGNSKSNLISSGLVVFISVGTLGTLYGASLANVEGVTPDNIISQISILLPEWHSLVYYTLIIIIFTSFISLLDGMYLAVALTLSKDIFHISHMKIIRFVLLPSIAFLSIWGIRFIQEAASLDLFDLVYLVVVSQLTLMGPILVGFLSDDRSRYMWISIAVGFLVGCTTLIIGGVVNNEFFLQSAGTFALLTSIIIAYSIKKK